MYEIEIADQQTHIAIDADFLVDATRQLLEAEQVARAEISIALVDDAAIWSLNRQFLQHDYPTDVLSFPLDDADSHNDIPEPATRFPDPPAPRGAGRTICGEVVISAEMALRTAAQYDWR